jgi:hypothetical protein
MLEDTERQFQNSARVMRLGGWSLAVVLWIWHPKRAPAVAGGS